MWGVDRCETGGLTGGKGGFTGGKGSVDRGEMGGKGSLPKTLLVNPCQINRLRVSNNRKNATYFLTFVALLQLISTESRNIVTEQSHNC